MTNFFKFSTHVVYGCVSFLYWRLCDKLSSSGFSEEEEDVMFAHMAYHAVYLEQLSLQCFLFCNSTQKLRTSPRGSCTYVLPDCCSIFLSVLVRCWAHHKSLRCHIYKSFTANKSNQHALMIKIITKEWGTDEWWERWLGRKRWSDVGKEASQKYRDWDALVLYRNHEMFNDPT